jgi:antitoxin FitA
MATLLIRNLDDSLKAALRKRAAANGRSMEEEARVILNFELRKRSAFREGLGTRLAKLFRESGAGELEIPPRTEMPRKPPFVTDEEWNKTS